MQLRTVLVADDSAMFRGMIGAVLAEQGLAVVEAADGIDALRLIDAERPGLVILDALMPGLSGFDVLRRLRERSSANVPVIFLVTGVFRSRRWAAEALAQFPIAEYVEKPVDPDELLRTILRHFPDTDVTAPRRCARPDSRRGRAAGAA